MVSAETLNALKKRQAQENRRKYFIQMGEIAQAHSEKTGHPHQVMIIGGNVGGFLVPVKSTSAGK